MQIKFLLKIMFWAYFLECYFYLLDYILPTGSGKFDLQLFIVHSCIIYVICVVLWLIGLLDIFISHLIKRYKQHKQQKALN